MWLIKEFFKGLFGVPIDICCRVIWKKHSDADISTSSSSLLEAPWVIPDKFTQSGCHDWSHLEHLTWNEHFDPTPKQGQPFLPSFWHFAGGALARELSAGPVLSVEILSSVEKLSSSTLTRLSKSLPLPVTFVMLLRCRDWDITFRVIVGLVGGVFPAEAQPRMSASGFLFLLLLIPLIIVEGLWDRGVLGIPGWTLPTTPASLKQIERSQRYLIQ